MIPGVAAQAQRKKAAAGGGLTLLHLNGANGSTTFVEESGKTVSRVPSGNGVISTADSKFGGACLYMQNATYAIVVADGGTGDLVLGTGPFTIECFIKINQTSFDTMNGAICIGGGITEGCLGFTGRSHSTPTPRFRPCVTRSATVALLDSGISINDLAWHHIAWSRDAAGVNYLHVDGVMTASITDTYNYTNSTNSMTIGRISTSVYSLGYIDEVRITKGSARYGAANFTPPTAEFPFP